MDTPRLKIRTSAIWESLAIGAIIGSIIFLTGLAIFDTDNFAPLILLPVYCVVPYLIVAAFIRASRRRRVGTVLMHVEEAVRLNLPLHDMMLAAAQSESGKTRRRLLALHDRLIEGQSLAPALYYALPELSPAKTRAIAAAERIGKLPEELRRMLNRYLPQGRHAPDLDRFYRIYAVLISMCMVALVSGLIAIVVFPKFESIAAAFGLKLPWITRLVMSLCSSYILVSAAAAVLLMAAIPWSGAIRDYIVWCIPVAGGAAQDRGMAELCAFLTDAMEAGLPMDAALREAEEAQQNAVLRRRLHRWRTRLESGQAIETAAGRAGMPALVGSMLKSAVNGEGKMQVMSFLARHYEYRFSRFREVLRAVAIPAFVTVMGALVLVVQLSIFQPMLSLIDSLSSGGHHRGGF